MSIGQVAKELGVSICTLRRWDKSGKLKSTLRTLGNHRRYLTLDIFKLKKTTRINIGYARVSSYDQKKFVGATRLKTNAAGITRKIYT